MINSPIINPLFDHICIYTWNNPIPLHVRKPLHGILIGTIVITSLRPSLILKFCVKVIGFNNINLLNLGWWVLHKSGWWFPVDSHATRSWSWKHYSNMFELWSKNLGALQKFGAMVSLLTLFVTIQPSRFWSISKMFLLESSSHDPPIEATDAGAIRPTDVALHRQRSIVPHPPKGLKHLKGQTVSYEMVSGCQLYLIIWRGMAILRALKSSCYCWLVFYVHAVCSPNSSILEVKVASCYCIQSNMIWYALCCTVVLRTICNIFLQIFIAGGKHLLLSCIYT